MKERILPLPKKRASEGLVGIRRDFYELAVLVSKSKAEGREVGNRANVLTQRLVDNYDVTPSELTQIIFDNPPKVYSRAVAQKLGLI